MLLFFKFALNFPKKEFSVLVNKNVSESEKWRRKKPNAIAFNRFRKKNRHQKALNTLKADIEMLFPLNFVFGVSEMFDLKRFVFSMRTLNSVSGANVVSRRCCLFDCLFFFCMKIRCISYSRIM